MNDEKALVEKASKIAFEKLDSVGGDIAAYGTLWRIGYASSNFQAWIEMGGAFCGAEGGSPDAHLDPFLSRGPPDPDLAGKRDEVLGNHFG